MVLCFQKSFLSLVMCCREGCGTYRGRKQFFFSSGRDFNVYPDHDPWCKGRRSTRLTNIFNVRDFGVYPRGLCGFP